LEPVCAVHWQIDDPTYIDEYTRAVALDPRTSALLVVDMQNASLRTFRRLWGRVMSTDEVIAELEGRRRGSPA
ncbi:MAG TPA: hypothetical protein VJ011_09865, partial [Steroidobacteraceae bacterium]|nr:hypothetical protein [Steroidobacteraceae bacterium]